MRPLARLCVAFIFAGELCGGFIAPSRTSFPGAVNARDMYPTSHVASLLLQLQSSEEIRIQAGKTNHRLSSTSSLFSSREDEQSGTDRRDAPRSVSEKRLRLKRLVGRFDTVQSAGLQNVQTQGLPGKVLSQLNRVNNPKVYLGLLALFGYRYRCFTNPFFLFVVAFCIKWYRARYVYKIPVWDRQPNWNNVITSKEQEKDLKAFTCKTCGSTLFVAKDRGFFFEGQTGLAGLGCFNCGAKGKDNFVNDRDRIVEDVAGMDDYFDYERPLDFVSAAERKKLLKQSGGDETIANRILLGRASGDAASNQPTGSASPMTADAVVDAEIVGSSSPSSPLSPPASAGSEPPVSPTSKSSKTAEDDDMMDLLDMD